MPFLDKDFLEVSMSLDPEFKMVRAPLLVTAALTFMLDCKPEKELQNAYVPK